jgi:LmbE family N-acetylglucosaminyl deacetylase
VLRYPLPDTGKPLRLLALGAHSDDIEIGAGATVLRLLAERPVHVTWVVFAAHGPRAKEARDSAAAFTHRAASADIRLHEFKDAFFPSLFAEIKPVFEGLKAAEPDLILTHCRHDLHQDHRVLCDLTWNTFRDHAILEYEVAKYDGDLASPNFFVSVTKEQAVEKTRLLRKHFLTQGVKHWFDEELFLGLMRIRGAESRSPGGYAEGYYARKVLL